MFKDSIWLRGVGSTRGLSRFKYYWLIETHKLSSRERCERKNVYSSTNWSSNLLISLESKHITSKGGGQGTKGIFGSSSGCWNYFWSREHDESNSKSFFYILIKKQNFSSKNFQSTSSSKNS